VHWVMSLVTSRRNLAHYFGPIPEKNIQKFWYVLDHYLQTLQFINVTFSTEQKVVSMKTKRKTSTMENKDGALLIGEFRGGESGHSHLYRSIIKQA